jgi:HK97 family phage prohead protease
MLVKKTLSLSNCDIKLDGETGKFSGYASVFGGVDSYGDTILRGAFDSTLRNHGKPKMFYGHQWDMPIGKWTKASEDDHGLYVEGELTPGLAKAGDVHAAMKHGTLDGLSIGGYLKKGDWEESAEGGRIIRRWSNLMEISPVVFPADSAARIDLGSVKNGVEIEAAIDGLETIRDFERFLRDAGGLSKGLAEALVSRAKSIFTPGEPGGEEVEAKAAQELQERFARFRVPASLIG